MKNVYDTFTQLVDNVLETNKDWKYIFKDNPDLMKEICNQSEELIKESDADAYELEVDDATGHLIISFEDVYTSVELDGESSLLSLIGKAESFSVMPIYKGTFKVSFRLFPIFIVR